MMNRAMRGRRGAIALLIAAVAVGMSGCRVADDELVGTWTSSASGHTVRLELTEAHTYELTGWPRSLECIASADGRKPAQLSDIDWTETIDVAGEYSLGGGIGPGEVQLMIDDGDCFAWIRLSAEKRLFGWSLLYPIDGLEGPEGESNVNLVFDTAG